MITIAFFTSSNIISKIIQFFLRSPISHSAIGLEINGVPMFLHSAKGGVQLTTREKMLEDHTLYAEFEILPDLSQEIPEALKRIGEKYDIPGLFGYVFVLIGRWLKLKIKNIFAQRHATVCSEFVVSCDINHEIPEFINLEPDEITPKDLLNICINGKSFRKIK